MTILTNTRAALSGVAVAALALTGVALGAAPANAAPTSTWDRVAQCESGGNWHINTGNGYYGGLQFSMSTWRGYGGTGNPANASKATQIRIAERVLAGQGWGAWPVCSVKAGARGTSSSVSASHAKKATKHVAKSTHAKKAVKHTVKHRGSVKLSGKVYTVKRGDTLAKIAAKLHVKGGWHRLADANRLANPNFIVVGQRLHLPA
ncbi:transglycosylase family protein [Amnibacterium endophyticum]|uniref:Transglycosylase family protein n=1 Tax=Amnibacterium endophyticum TaxID=2109337 RepID=A0ABW4LG44_9MICO